MRRSRIKGWAHYFEMMLGMETDTSEIVNEMITSVRSYGRCGITGIYVGFTNHFNIGSLSMWSISIFETVLANEILE